MQEAKRNLATSISAPLLRAFVRVVDNPKQGLVRLKSVCRVGSRSDMDVIVNDTRVLPFHCLLQWHQACWYLVNVAGQSETFVNGVAILDKTLLCDGDRIDIGSSTLEFVVDRETTQIDKFNAGCETYQEIGDDWTRAYAKTEESAGLSGLAMRLRSRFDQSADADLERRIAFALRELLTTTGGNLAYVRLPEATVGNLTLKTLSALSLRQTPWIELNPQLSEEVINRRKAIFRRWADLEFGYVPLLIDSSIVGLLHVFSVKQPCTRLAESKTTCLLAGEILGLLIAQHLKSGTVETQDEKNTKVISGFQYKIVDSLKHLFSDSDWPCEREVILNAISSREQLLVIGESGTGRMRVAQTITKASVQTGGDCVDIDCSDEQFDRLLRKTLSRESRHSHLCDHTTFIIRNIEKLPPSSQLRLESTLEDLLSGSPAQSQLITIADPGFDDAVCQGAISGKLASLLGTSRIYLTQLCDRPDEIPKLIEHLVFTCTNIFEIDPPIVTQEAVDACVAYQWPGNWVELTQAIYAACLECEGRRICKSDLLFINQKSATPTQGFASLADATHAHIHAAMDVANGNKLQASKLLKINRSTLNRKLESYNRLRDADDKK